MLRVVLSLCLTAASSQTIKNPVEAFRKWGAKLVSEWGDADKETWNLMKGCWSGVMRYDGHLGTKTAQSGFVYCCYVPDDSTADSADQFPHPGVPVNLTVSFDEPAVGVPIMTQRYTGSRFLQHGDIMFDLLFGAPQNIMRELDVENIWPIRNFTSANLPERTVVLASATNVANENANGLKSEVASAELVASLPAGTTALNCIYATLSEDHSTLRISSNAFFMGTKSTTGDIAWLGVAYSCPPEFSTLPVPVDYFPPRARACTNPECLFLSETFHEIPVYPKLDASRATSASAVLQRTECRRDVSTTTATSLFFHSGNTVTMDANEGSGIFGLGRDATVVAVAAISAAVVLATCCVSTIIVMRFRRSTESSEKLCENRMPSPPDSGVSQDANVNVIGATSKDRNDLQPAGATAEGQGDLQPAEQEPQPLFPKSSLPASPRSLLMAAQQPQHAPAGTELAAAPPQLKFQSGVDSDAMENRMGRDNTEDVFTGDVKEIIELGVSEHWYIPSDHITVLDSFDKGGYGEVRRGLLLDSSEVAIKVAVMREKEKEFASKCHVLANEVRLFRRVRHQNIVLFHGVVLQRSPEGSMQLGIVLEWVEGGNFEAYCKWRHQEGAYGASESQVLLPSEHISQQKDRCLLVDVTRGMLYLHALVPIILHRDLKPANILIDKVEPPRAKLTDFGLSTLLARDQEVNKRAGTRAYMAPEVKESRPYNSAADVFSFGCVVLFLLTAQHPPKDKDAREVAQGFVNDAAMPEVLVNMACKALHYLPALRPTFADMYATLTGLHQIVEVTESTTCGTGEEPSTTPSPQNLVQL